MAYKHTQKRRNVRGSDLQSSHLVEKKRFSPIKILAVTAPVVLVGLVLTAVGTLFWFMFDTEYATYVYEKAKHDIVDSDSPFRLVSPHAEVDSKIMLLRDPYNDDQQVLNPDGIAGFKQGEMCELERGDRLTIVKKLPDDQWLATVANDHAGDPKRHKRRWNRDDHCPNGTIISVSEYDWEEFAEKFNDAVESAKTQKRMDDSLSDYFQDMQQEE